MGGGVTRSFSRVLFIRHFFGSRGGFCTNLPNSRGWEFSVNDRLLFAFVSRPLLVHHTHINLPYINLQNFVKPSPPKYLY